MPDTKNIPIRYGKYINHEMEEEKVIFIGAEKAIYGADGRRLDEKLIDMEDSLSDAFSTEKDYAAGDYCVYANRVFKFTKAKAAGEWDGAAVIPVSLAQEIRANAQGIAAINGSFVSLNSYRFTQGLVNDNTIQMQVNSLNEPGNAKGLNFNVNLNTGEYRVNYQKDNVWATSSVLALKSDLGNTRGMQLMQSYVTDIDNPPLAIILQAAVSDTKGTLPTGIGGSIFIIIQSNPTMAYKQYNSQLAIGFGSDKIAFRRRIGGEWTAWKYLAFS